MDLVWAAAGAAMTIFVIFCITHIPARDKHSFHRAMAHMITVAAVAAIICGGRIALRAGMVCLLATAASVVTTLMGKRRIATDRPIIVMSNGKIIPAAMKKGGISTDQLMATARTHGYFSLSDIDSAVVEADGSISLLPTAMARELNPRDFNFAPIRTGVPTVLVLDGRMLPDGIRAAELSVAGVERLLTDRHVDIKNVLLLTINEAGQIEIFCK